MRKPSAETELRYYKRQLAESEGKRRELGLSEERWRGRATRAEQEAAEWKRRFDLLLSKCGLPKPDAGD